MSASGSSYADALEEATRLGYAEADPSADVDGYDAASKAAILASLAFHTRVTAADVYCEGIRQVTAADIAAAAETRLRDQAAGDLRAHCSRRRGRRQPRGRLGARLPGDDPGRAPARERRRRVQRRLRRGRSRRSAHVLRAGRRRRAHGERRARRPRRGGAQPRGRRAWAARVGVRQPAGAADGHRAHALPREPRRGRPRRCARRDRRRVRPPRREHRGGAADRRRRQRRRGAPGWSSSPTRRRRRRWRPPWTCSPGWTSCAASTACCGSRTWAGRVLPDDRVLRRSSRAGRG